MYKFLEAWEGSIPAVQGSQIVKLLTDMKDQGIIKTEQEYRDALNRLSGAIRATDPVPLSKLFPALLDNYIDSESFNWMIDRITSDLVAGFTEAQTIEDLMIAHRKVYEEFTLAKLKQIIGIVEERVAFHEFLRQNQEGYSNMQYNTFTQNARSTDRSTTLERQLFYDRSSRSAIESEHDAVIDVVNEALELPATDNVQLFTIANEDPANTTKDIFDTLQGAPDFDIALAKNNIINGIDGIEGTFYIRPFLMSEVSTSGVQLKIELNCGTLRPLNYIEIHPVADYPFQITTVEYLDENDVIASVELQESGLLGTDVYRPIRLHFKEITARKLYLTTTQVHYTLISFQGSSIKEYPSENFEGTYLETQAVQDIVRDAMDDDAFLNHLRDLFSQTDSKHRVYQYIMGFDNIWAGRLAYDKVGIFVSESFKVSRCRLVGLNANEVDTTDILANQQASIEYWMYKQDYNSIGGLIGITALPIMNEGDTEAYERLHLTERTGGSAEANTATLRFQGHWGGGEPTTVSVYMNGLPLEQGVDWTFTDLADLGLLNYTRITLTLPQGGEIYTARYTPVQHLSGAETSKHYQRNQPYAYFFGATNIIRTVGEIGSEEIEDSDIYLIVIMRHNNNINNTQSPRVNEYSLLTASQDPNKLYS